MNYNSPPPPILLPILLLKKYIFIKKHVAYGLVMISCWLKSHGNSMWKSSLLIRSTSLKWGARLNKTMTPNLKQEKRANIARAGFAGSAHKKFEFYSKLSTNAPPLQSCLILKQGLSCKSHINSAIAVKSEDAVKSENISNRHLFRELKKCSEQNPPNVNDAIEIWKELRRLKLKPNIYMLEELLYTVSHCDATQAPICNAVLNELKESRTFSEQSKFIIRLLARLYKSKHNNAIGVRAIMDFSLENNIELNCKLYNGYLSSLMKAGELDDITFKQCLKEMNKRGLSPSSVTFNIFLNSLAKANLLNEHTWEIVLNTMITKGIHPDEVTFEIMLSILARSNAHPKFFIDIIEKMKSFNLIPTINCYNHFLHVLSEQERRNPTDFLKHIYTLRTKGIRFNHGSVDKILLMLSNCRDLSREDVQEILETLKVYNVQLSNKLVYSTIHTFTRSNCRFDVMHRIPIIIEELQKYGCRIDHKIAESCMKEITNHNYDFLPVCEWFLLYCHRNHIKFSPNIITSRIYHLNLRIADGKSAGVEFLSVLQRTGYPLTDHMISACVTGIISKEVFPIQNACLLLDYLNDVGIKPTTKQCNALLFKCTGSDYAIDNGMLVIERMKRANVPRDNVTLNCAIACMMTQLEFSEDRVVQVLQYLEPIVGAGDPSAFISEKTNLDDNPDASHTDYEYSLKHEIQHSIQLDVRMLSAFVKKLVIKGLDLTQFRRLLMKLSAIGVHIPDSIWMSVLHAVARTKSDLAYVWGVMNDMISCGHIPDLKCYTIALSVCTKNTSNFNKCISIIDQMASLGVYPDAFIFGMLFERAALSCPKDLRIFHELICLMKRYNVSPEDIISKKYVSVAYSSPGVDIGFIDKIFEIFEKENIPIYRSTIKQYFAFMTQKESFDINKGFAMIDKAQSNNIQLCEGTYGYLISALAKQNPPDLKACHSLIERMKNENIDISSFTFTNMLLGLLANEPNIHDCDWVLRIMRQADVKPNINTYNTYLTATKKAGKLDMTAIQTILDDLGLEFISPNLETFGICFSSLAGFPEKNFLDCELLIQRMIASGIMPDEIILKHIFSIFYKSNVEELKKFSGIVSVLRKHGIVLNEILIKSALSFFKNKDIYDLDCLVSMFNLIIENGLNCEASTYYDFLECIGRFADPTTYPILSNIAAHIVAEAKGIDFYTVYAKAILNLNADFNYIQDLVEEIGERGITVNKQFFDVFYGAQRKLTSGSDYTVLIDSCRFMLKFDAISKHDALIFIASHVLQYQNIDNMIQNKLDIAIHQKDLSQIIVLLLQINDQIGGNDQTIRFMNAMKFV